MKNTQYLGKINMLMSSHKQEKKVKCMYSMLTIMYKSISIYLSLLLPWLWPRIEGILICAGVSQFQYYWQFGLGNSFAVGSPLCIQKQSRSPASTPQMPAVPVPPNWDNQKCLQTLPDLLLGEQNWSRLKTMDLHHQQLPKQSNSVLRSFPAANSIPHIPQWSSWIVYLCISYHGLKSLSIFIALRKKF